MALEVLKVQPVNRREIVEKGEAIYQRIKDQIEKEGIVKRTMKSP